MVKQKIQDNLSVLEKDCTEVLLATENVLRANLHKKARAATIYHIKLYSIAFLLLGILLLSSYLFLSLLSPTSTFISNPHVMGRCVSVFFSSSLLCWIISNAKKEYMQHL